MGLVGGWVSLCPRSPLPGRVREEGGKGESGKRDCPGLWYSTRAETNIYVKLRVQEKPSQADLSRRWNTGARPG